MIRNLLLMSLFVFASTAWGQDAPFITGWNGHFAHGGTVTLNGSVFAKEKTETMKIAIGDHSDFEQCTRHVSQTADDWGDGSATFEVDANNFTEGEQVYVFLIGEDGAVSGGHGVTLGDKIPDPDGPGQPGQPMVNSH